MNLRMLPMFAAMFFLSATVMADSSESWSNLDAVGSESKYVVLAPGTHVLVLSMSEPVSCLLFDMDHEPIYMGNSKETPEGNIHRCVISWANKKHAGYIVTLATEKGKHYTYTARFLSEK